MVKLPTRIQVGSSTFEVEEYVKEVADAKGHWGKCSWKDAKIYVDTSGNTARTTNTLLHEVVHAIAREWGIELVNPEENERFVECLTNGLLTTLRQNPALVKVIVAGVK